MSARYRHIVWDWNGTLLDDLDLCVEIMNGVLSRRGRPAIDRARYHALFDFPVRHFYERLGFLLEGDELARLGHEFISTYDGRRLETTLHTGVVELLAAIEASGRQQSILSAHREQTLEEIVRHFGLHAHFHRIAGLPDIHAHGKLDRGRALVAELGLPADSILLVGDTLHDLEVAQALGIDCVLVANGHHSADRLRGKAPLVLSGVHELVDHLELEAFLPAPR